MKRRMTSGMTLEEFEKGYCPDPKYNHIHVPVKVSTQRWRDWFRYRLWWRCWKCDAKEEAKK
jgi:hypothetical protein